MDNEKNVSIQILNNRSLLTAKEFGKLTGISEVTVRRHCYDGTIKSRKIGRSLRIPVSELQTNC